MEFCEPALFEREQFERIHMASMSEELLDSLIERDWCVIRAAAALQYFQTGKYILNTGLIILDFEEKNYVSHKALF